MAGQRGFLLVEFALGALLATLLTVWASQALVQRINRTAVVSAARWMQSIEQATRHYLQRHGQAIRLAQARSELAGKGYADWAAPTLAELKSGGLLQPGFPERALQVQGVMIQVLRDGTCPGPECQIDAIIASQKPLSDQDGSVDEQKLAQWMMATGGQGGMVHPDRSGRLEGPAFSFDNPVLPDWQLSPGTVALAVTRDQLNASDFLRVKDPRDPDFQGGLTVQEDVQTAGDVRTGGVLRFDTSRVMGTACGQEGDVARDSISGLLTCAGGIWQAFGRSNGAYSYNSTTGCLTPDGRSSANPVTGACSCPEGSVAIQVAEGAPEDHSLGTVRGYVCL